MNVEIVSAKDNVVRIVVNNNVIAFYDVKVSGKKFENGKFVDVENYKIGFSVFNLNEDSSVDGLIENLDSDEVSIELI